MTLQRRVILEALRAVDSHPTADRIYQMVRRRLPRISLGTVYRNLEILSEHGLIRKLELSGAQMRFDGDLEAHHHVRCTRCGRLADVSVDLPAAIDKQVRALSDYEIVGYRLEFVGICPKCGHGRRNRSKTG